MILNITLNCSDCFVGIFVDIPAALPFDFLRTYSTNNVKSVYDFFASVLTLFTLI
jgi:hypothetical protein